MLYQFKQQVEDFMVSELLPEYPNGAGDVFYVFFEKKNLTTMEVIEYVGKVLHLSREDLGIAGLKDKVGITRQRITVYSSVLARVGGESAFLNCLSGIVEVLQTTWGNEPLRVGSNSGNRFFVKLRAKEVVSEEKKNLIQQNIETIQVKGFPNCFGSQRFGKKNKNFWEAKGLMEAGLSHSSSFHSQGAYHLRFMLQAYASMYFNMYVMNRWEKGQRLLGGDIVVDCYFAKGTRIGVYQNQDIQFLDYLGLKKRYEGKAFLEIGGSDLGNTSPYKKEQWIPTGPMLGWNLLLSPQGTKARVRDDLLLAFAEFDEQAQEVCKLYQLWGIRRPLWVYVDDLEWRFEGDDLLLEFSLPTGSYATVVLAFVLQDVDRLTLKDNRLEIPRIEKSLNQ